MSQRDEAQSTREVLRQVRLVRTLPLVLVIAGIAALTVYCLVTGSPLTLPLVMWGAVVLGFAIVHGYAAYVERAVRKARTTYDLVWARSGYVPLGTIEERHLVKPGKTLPTNGTSCSGVLGCDATTLSWHPLAGDGHWISAWSLPLSEVDRLEHLQSPGPGLRDLLAVTVHTSPDDTTDAPFGVFLRKPPEALADLRSSPLAGLLRDPLA